jgi:Holliday junction resolvase RusA-like endonuclease
MKRSKGKENYAIIKVDGIPPSVNHYVRHSRSGRHYKDGSAKEFSEKLALACSASRPVHGMQFEVHIWISLGKRQKGDIDNFPKVVLDSISRAGMLRNYKTGSLMSDSHVTHLQVTKERGERSMTTVEIIGVNEKA